MFIHSKRYLWLVLVFLLAACGSAEPAVTAAPQTTSLPSLTATPAVAQATPTTISLPTASPTATIPAAETSQPTADSSPAGRPESDQVVTVPGLRMAYIVDGNLYVQDSGGPYTQLTQGGMDASPRLSDDGQKLLFLRPKHPDDKKNGLPIDLYSINADGSGERVLVTYEKLKEIDAQQYGDRPSQAFSFFFIPGTHQVLFDTAIPGLYGSPYDNRDMFWADADSGQIRQLAAIEAGWYRGVSPDGQWLAFQRIIDGQPTGQIDLIGFDGKIIRPNIFASMFPESGSQFSQDYVSAHWVADGSRLLVVPGYSLDLPVMGRVIWQYSVADGSTAEIHFDPPPSAHMFDISPDGEWIAYTHYTATDEHDDSYGVYLGNLRTSETRKLVSRENYQASDEYAWSPDNTHFYFSDSFTGSGFMGDIHGNVEPVGNQFHFLGWIDSRHYMCGMRSMGEVGKTEREQFIAPPRPLAGYGGFDFVLLK